MLESKAQLAQPFQSFVINKDKPVASQVHGCLRTLILRIGLRPGKVLSEKDLSVKLGVSRTPVREAFIRLAEEGLVDILPQRGTVVSPIRVPEIEEAYFLRHAIEIAVVSRVAKNIEVSQLEQLKAHLVQQKKVLQNNDYHAFMDLDDDFHRILSEGARLPRAWRMIQSVKGQLDRLRFMTLPESGHGQRIQDQHHAIFAAVAEGDAERAQAEMHNHLHEIWGFIERMMRENAELFQDGGNSNSLKRR